MDKYLDDVRFCMDTDDKNIRESRYNAVVEKMIAEFGEEYPEINEQLEEITYKIQKKVVKEWLLRRPAARARLRPVHQRPDAGAVGRNPRDAVRIAESRHDL